MWEKCCDVNLEQAMNDASVLPSDISFFQRGWLSSNNVLLQDDQHAVLIDSGYWTHAQQTQDLVKLALGDASLTRLINTHLHSDHCGGNAQLQLSYPQLHTLVPPGHADFVFDWDPAALTYTPTGQHCPQFVANDVIRSGDRFSVSGREWVAHAACELWGDGAKLEIAEDASLHEARNLMLDISKARSLLNWSPCWSVGEALEKVLRWHKCFNAGESARLLCERDMVDFDQSFSRVMK